MLYFRYLLKPEIMCRSDRQFDPFTESVIDGMVAASVTVKVCDAFFFTTCCTSLLNDKTLLWLLSVFGEVFISKLEYLNEGK